MRQVGAAENRLHRSAAVDKAAEPLAQALYCGGIASWQSYRVQVGQHFLRPVETRVWRVAAGSWQI
jgi:hypothetical protein